MSKQRRKYNSKPKMNKSDSDYEDTEKQFRDRNRDGHRTGKKFNGRTLSAAKSNDPQWYFKDRNILEGVASFSFNQPLGSRFYFNNYLPEIPGVEKNSQVTAAIPGLMTLHIAPSPGVSLDAQSPFNLAATNVYSYVRYKNSGGANYDAPDLMMYLMAMDSVYSCWNWLKRIYGLASTYSQLNRYEPKAYMVANGVDYDDLTANLADFRAWLNMKANEISAFCVPATMSYNVRHSWLFSNVYKDAESAKAQQYMYVPSFFYEYDETSSPTGGILKVVPILNQYNPNTGHKYTVNELKAILNGMLEALNYSEDIGIMSGDILKAYGESGLFHVSTFESDYKVEAVYSKEVLTQIENAHPINIADADYVTCTLVNDPNTNFVQYQPRFTADNGTFTGAYLNFHWSDPTPDDVVVATRLMFTMSRDDQNRWVLESCGSELCTGGWIYTLAESTIVTDGISSPSAPLKVVGFRIWPEKPLTYLEDTAGVIYEWLYRFVVMHSTFDWHPFIPITVHPLSTDIITCLGLCGDFDVYTFLTESNIAAINSMALLTEFNVPN